MDVDEATGRAPQPAWMSDNRMLFLARYGELKREEREMEKRYDECDTLTVDGKTVPRELRGDHFRYAKAQCFAHCFEAITDCMVKQFDVPRNVVRRFVSNGAVHIACLSIFVRASDSMEHETVARHIATSMSMAWLELKSCALFDTAQCIFEWTASGDIAVFIDCQQEAADRGSCARDGAAGMATSDIFDAVAALNLMATVAVSSSTWRGRSSAVRVIPHVMRFSVDNFMVDMYAYCRHDDDGTETLATHNITCKCMSSSSSVHALTSSTVFVDAYDCRSEYNMSSTAGLTIAAAKLCCGALCIAPCFDPAEWYLHDHVLRQVVSPLMFPGALDGVRVARVNLVSSDDDSPSTLYCLHEGRQLMRLFSVIEPYLLYVFVHPQVYERAFALVDECTGRRNEDIDRSREPRAFQKGAHLRCAVMMHAELGRVGGGCAEHAPLCTIITKYFDHARTEMTYIGVVSLSALRDRLSPKARAFDYVGQWMRRCERAHLCRCSLERLAHLLHSADISDTNSDRGSSPAPLSAQHAFSCEDDVTFLEMLCSRDAMSAHRDAVASHVCEENEYKKTLHASACRVTHTVPVELEYGTPLAASYEGNYCVMVDGIEFGALEVAEGVLCTLECRDAAWVERFAFCVTHDDMSSGKVVSVGVGKRPADVLDTYDACRKHGIEEFERFVSGDSQKSHVRFRLTSQFIGNSGGTCAVRVCFGCRMKDGYVVHGTVDLADNDDGECAVHPSLLDLESKRVKCDANDSPPSPSVQDAPLHNDTAAQPDDAKPAASTAASSSADDTVVSPRHRHHSRSEDVFARKMTHAIDFYGIVFLLTSASRVPATGKQQYVQHTPLTPVDAPKKWRVAFVNVDMHGCKHGLVDVDGATDITRHYLSASKMRVRGNAFYHFAFVLDKEVHMSVRDYDDWPRLVVHSAHSGRHFAIPPITEFDRPVQWSEMVYVPDDGRPIPAQVRDDEVYRCPLEVRDRTKRVVCRIVAGNTVRRK